MFLTGREKEMYLAGFNKLALLALAGWSLEEVHMPLQKINLKKILEWCWLSKGDGNPVT